MMMKKQLKLRIALVAAVAALSVIYTVPSLPFFHNLSPGVKSFFPDKSINLGLDLQGGTHLVLEIDTSSAIRETSENYGSDARRLLAGLGIRVSSVETEEQNPRRIDIILQEPASRNEALRAVLSEFSGWEIEPKGHSAITMVMPRTEAETIQSAVQRQALSTIRNRVDEFGVAEPSIQPEGGNRIVIQLPGMKDTGRARELVGRTARLTFHLALTNTETWDLISRIDREAGTSIRNYVRTVSGMQAPAVRAEESEALMEICSSPEVTGLMPAGHVFAPGRQETREGRRYQELYVVRERPEIGGEMLRNAYVGFQAMETVVNIEFNRRGAILFERITRENVERPLAIILDGIVQSAPIIRSEIPRTSTGHISGRFTSEEASDLAIMLRAGALPASIEIAYE